VVDSSSPLPAADCTLTTKTQNGPIPGLDLPRQSGIQACVYTETPRATARSPRRSLTFRTHRRPNPDIPLHLPTRPPNEVFGPFAEIGNSEGALTNTQASFFPRPAEFKGVRTTERTPRQSPAQYPELLSAQVLVSPKERTSSKTQRLVKNSKNGDCPDFCVSKNGTVPFARRHRIDGILDTKIRTGPAVSCPLRPSCSPRPATIATQPFSLK
jgi:hypothetical protein